MYNDNRYCWLLKIGKKDVGIKVRKDNKRWKFCIWGFWNCRMEFIYVLGVEFLVWYLGIYIIGDGFKL